MEHKALTIELKGERGEFSARIATLNVVDHDGDLTLPGAFPVGAEVVVSAYGHSSWSGALPVGKARIVETSDSVIAEGQFNLNTSLGRDTYEAVKFSGSLQEWSYGFQTVETSQGQAEGKNVRFLKRVTPYEISPVLRGAGMATGTLAIKSADGDETKPYAVEHACRLRDPDDFQDGSFRRMTRKTDGKDYDVIMGRLTGETTMTEQAYRYDKDTWDADDAKSHCADHDGTFEAASKSAKSWVYADHAERLLLDVEAFIERSKSLADLRLKGGRALSEVNRARLSKLQSSLCVLEGEIVGMLASTDPGKAKLEALRLKTEYTRIKAGITTGV